MSSKRRTKRWRVGRYCAFSFGRAESAAMNENSLNMIAPPEVYRRRRARLASALTRPMVIAAGRARARNYGTNTYPFRAGSSYLYFGGPPVKGAAWVIEPGGDGEAGCALFRPEVGFEDAVWVGETESDEQLAGVAGLDVGRLRPVDELERFLGVRSACYVAPPCPLTAKWIGQLGVESAGSEELEPIISLRLIKDEHELVAMRRAADVTVKAHLAAMRATRAGGREADVAAAFTAVLVAHECIPSFTPIVTVHGEVLHSECYPHAMADGQLLLVDAGAEEPGGYASDVTRTYPVSGAFTRIQRQLYDTVLRAEREAIAACVPGRRYRDVHDLAARVVCEGLVEAELLRGDPADLASRSAHTLFFTHGVGHLIGLDVHDMEDFGDLAGYAPGRMRRQAFGSKYLRFDRDLEPGMVVTIEPGVYFVPAIWRQTELLAPFADVVNRPAVDALLEARFGGIRVEDTVCVGKPDASGPEVLTGGLPSDGDEVTAVVNETAH
jgi:Xaa-Pro aminopeptidase